MNKITLPQLAIKILGLVLLVIGFSRVPFAILDIINAVATQGANSFLALALNFPYVVYIISGCIFFFASKKVSNKLIVSEDEQVTPATVEALQSILYSAVGLCLTVLVFPRFAELFAERVYMKSINAVSSMDGYYITQTISVAVQLVAGIWLFLGSKGLIGVRNKLRYWRVKDIP